jgi:hypothetical protein
MAPADDTCEAEEDRAMARARPTRRTNDEVEQASAEAQRESEVAAVEAQQPVGSPQVEMVDAPFGSKFGSGRSRTPGNPPEPRAETFVSAVNGGAHLNLYLSAALMEVASQWANGVQVRWQMKDGKSDVSRLRAAAKAYTLRKRGQQRPHFTIPMAKFGGAASNHEAVPAESWVDGDEICICIPAGFFSTGEGQP